MTGARGLAAFETLDDYFRQSIIDYCGLLVFLPGLERRETWGTQLWGTRGHLAVYRTVFMRNHPQPFTPIHK